MLYLLRVLVAVSVTFITLASASAQRADRWSSLDVSEGIGTGICDKVNAGSVCLKLQCGRNRGMEITLTNNYNAFGDASSALISVDGKIGATIALESGSANVRFNDGQHTKLIELLKAGNRSFINANSKAFAISLSGSGKEIDRVFAECQNKHNFQAFGVNTFGNETARYSDEATMSFPPKDQNYDWSFKKYQNTDIWGNDHRSGLTDPFLKSMSLNQCEKLCSITKKCLFYTHNSQNNTCFLKTAVGQVKGYRGATTGEFIGSRSNLFPPPTLGPGTIIDPRLSLHDKDTTTSWIRRLRNASEDIGLGCSDELEIMKSASETLLLNTSRSHISVGQSLDFIWSGNTLKKSVPMWIMVAADEPLRFSGKGFFALGPGAPNPFGIDFDKNKHRALVALHGRGASHSGKFEMRTLKAGITNLDIAIVGYQRNCQMERVFERSTVQINSDPGTAQLVLNNELGRSAYSYEVHLESFKRRVIFNDHRLLILDDETGSEIIERAGKELNFSPTHRFAAVMHNSKWDIVDVVDGATVAQARPGDILWSPGDSFVITTSAPWGEVNIHSTFWDGVNVVNQVTGPSCCAAATDSTRVAIDLENIAVSIWGRHGWHISALQNQSYFVGENNGSAYASSETGHDALYQHMFNSIGPAAPVSFAKHFNASGPILKTVDGEDRYGINGILDANPRTDEEIQTMRLKRVGLTIEPFDVSKQIGAVAGRYGLSVPQSLDRIGIETAEMLNGETLLQAPDYGTEGETGYGYKGRTAKASAFMNDLKAEAAKSGFTFQWTEPFATGATLEECDHIAVGSKLGYGEEKGNYVPNDVVEINKLKLKKGNVWVARSDCQAGATFGSLRGRSGLYIFDIDRGLPATINGIEASSGGYYVNNRRKNFYENELKIKGAKKYLVIYAPKNGVISVYDRDLRNFVWIADNLPNGDLLADVFLTTDFKYAVQSNSDGGIYIYRISDGKNVLSGRIVDDEVAVWVDDFRFDSTAEAAALVDLRFPGKLGQYSLDRFGSAKRVPGLAKLLLSGEVIPEAKSAGVPPDLAGEIGLSDEGAIRLNLEASNSDIKRLSLFQDGVLTNTIDVTADEVSRPIHFDRIKGARWASAVVTDSHGLTSLPVTADLGRASHDTSKNRALVIGINTYEDPNIPSLNYALRDGGKIAEALQSISEEGSSFDDIAFIKDRNATPETLVAGIKKLLKGLEKGDHAVLFFAGHGFRSQDGVFHFGVSTTKLESIGATALSFDRVAELLLESDARITILLDACHSGAASSTAFATNDEIVSNLADLNSNITVLAASKGREFSQESSDVGGGVFTNALAAVLAENRAIYDFDSNGRIEASELYNGVKSIVVNEMKGKQTPWMVRTRMVGDYALF